MRRSLLTAICIILSCLAFGQNREYPSPDGKYCLYYSETDKQYYMHDNRMDYSYCVTCDDVDDDFDDVTKPAWRVNSRYVYLSGRYDIWQIDITRAVAPMKITRRKKDAPVKFFLLLHEEMVPAGEYIYMKSIDTSTGISGRASFFQRGYKYKYRNYK